MPHLNQHAEAGSAGNYNYKQTVVIPTMMLDTLRDEGTLSCHMLCGLAVMTEESVNWNRMLYNYGSWRSTGHDLGIGFKHMTPL